MIVKDYVLYAKFGQFIKALYVLGKDSKRSVLCYGNVTVMLRQCYGNVLIESRYNLGAISEVLIGKIDNSIRVHSLIPKRLYFPSPRVMITMPFSIRLPAEGEALPSALLSAMPEGREWSPQRVMQSRGDNVCVSRL